MRKSDGIWEIVKNNLFDIMTVILISKKKNFQNKNGEMKYI